MTMLVREAAVAIGATPATLAAITDPGCALAVWDRTAPAFLHPDPAMLDLDGIDDLMLEVATDAFPIAALTAAGYPDPVAGPLHADLSDLLHLYAVVSGETRATVRLDVVESDACRRFHADYVPLRLLCTYVGPATQWHRCDAPDAIHQLRTGAVAIFKGRAMLDPPSVLHRSPPIIASSEQRLLLVIDKVRRPDPA